MYRNSNLAVDIEIDLPNGIYSLDSYSGAGKTRLAKLLRVIQKRDRDVISFSYDDLLVGASLEQLLEFIGCIPKVIMLDRYDLYKGHYTELLNSYADESIILIDCKTETPVELHGDEFALIISREDSITVKR